jgi:hypothetical protein
VLVVSACYSPSAWVDGRWLCTTCRPHLSRSWMCPTSVLVGFSMMISVAVLRAWCLLLLLLSVGVAVVWFLLLTSGNAVCWFARFAASAQPTTPPGTPAMAATHFLKDKKISIPLCRRFRFWLLCVLWVFASRLGQRTRLWWIRGAAGVGRGHQRHCHVPVVCLPWQMDKKRRGRLGKWTKKT